MPDSAVVAELDAAHERAQSSYRAKDLSAYMRLFAPTLKYKQLNGRVIGREQLANDVQRQFAIVEAAESSYVRESVQIDGDRATELLTQVASTTTRHFILFKRVWRLKRRGRYVWQRQTGGWAISEVEVLSEDILRGAA